jgi:hypothetical protein
VRTFANIKEAALKSAEDIAGGGPLISCVVPTAVWGTGGARMRAFGRFPVNVGLDLSIDGVSCLNARGQQPVSHDGITVRFAAPVLTAGSGKQLHLVYQDSSGYYGGDITILGRRGGEG